jgi:hypothetical protein
MSEMYREDMNLGIGAAQIGKWKKPCLYVRQGDEIYKAASFNNENAAEIWWNTLCLLVYGKEKSNDECRETE